MLLSLLHVLSLLRLFLHILKAVVRFRMRVDAHVDVTAAAMIKQLLTIS